MHLFVTLFSQYFQGMDAADNDGGVRHVMSGINSQSGSIFSFKQTSAEELKHDFFWRTTRCLPERGRICMLNRSCCEEVLVAGVHPEISNGQGLLNRPVDLETIWDDRYRSNVDREEYFYRNGTQIIKFFPHL